MRILVAPDKFKGSLSAAEAARAMAAGIRDIFPRAEIVQQPIADGGEGTMEILVSALGGERREVRVMDPLGRPVLATYGWMANREEAIVEMAAASGHARLTPEERDPLTANTYGTGELIRAAIDAGARHILVGLGGSATTDAGVGMSVALGYRFLDARDREVPPEPRRFSEIVRIEPPEHLPDVTITALCDVGNPLLGPRGTCQVFAPQKGAGPGEIEQLERGLASICSLLGERGETLASASGAGSAGGLGFGLQAFCGATLTNGFWHISRLLGLRQVVSSCDLILTGEGRLDATTSEGKGPAGLAQLAREAGRPIIALAGTVDRSPDLDNVFDATFAIVDSPMTLHDALRSADNLLFQTTRQIARLLKTTVYEQ